MLPDEEGIGLGAKLFAGAASLVAAFVGVMKLWKGALDGKADKEQVERHKQANDAQTARHHAAILDLYAKNDKVLDLLRDQDRNATERHLEVVKMIGALK